MFSSIPRSRYKALQQRIQTQQEEIYKFETGRDPFVVCSFPSLSSSLLAIQDYRAKLDVLREENESLLKRVTIFWTEKSDR